MHVVRSIVPFGKGLSMQCRHKLFLLTMWNVMGRSENMQIAHLKQDADDGEWLK